MFQPELDDSTTTDPLDPDMDNDGLLAGEEDVNFKGRVETSCQGAALPP